MWSGRLAAYSIWGLAALVWARSADHSHFAAAIGIDKKRGGAVSTALDLSETKRGECR
jgi:hypothetical protein